MESIIHACFGLFQGSYLAYVLVNLAEVYYRKRLHKTLPKIECFFLSEMEKNIQKSYEKFPLSIYIYKKYIYFLVVVFSSLPVLLCFNVRLECWGLFLLTSN